MNWRHTALLIALCVAFGLGWLALERFDNVAYLTSDYTSVTGWAALRTGWFIYGWIAAVTMVFGLSIGAWIGVSSRERDAQEQLQTLRSALEIQLQQARTSDERALQREQQAREKTAAAEQARRDAEALIAPGQQRINALSEENALLKQRLNGSIAGLERKKQQVRQLKHDSRKLCTEIETWQNLVANQNRFLTVDVGEPPRDD